MTISWSRMKHVVMFSSFEGLDMSGERASTFNLTMLVCSIYGSICAFLQPVPFFDDHMLDFFRCIIFLAQPRSLSPNMRWFYYWLDNLQGEGFFTPKPWKHRIWLQKLVIAMSTFRVHLISGLEFEAELRRGFLMGGRWEVMPLKKPWKIGVFFGGGDDDSIGESWWGV